MPFLQDVLVKLRLKKSDKRKFIILDQLSGYIPPNRICLLLGPPGSGKSTLLQALAGKLQNTDGLKASFVLHYKSPPLATCLAKIDHRQSGQSKPSAIMMM